METIVKVIINGNEWSIMHSNTLYYVLHGITRIKAFLSPDEAKRFLKQQL
jgi:hypothetical protein